MNEYELYTRILAPHLKCNNQELLVEYYNDTHQECKVIGEKVQAYAIYRYDMNEQKDKFLPFFNKTHCNEDENAEYSAVKNLLRFCDYIVLVNNNDKLTVILVEMKSGNNNATEQLLASECFMKYVLMTAERVSIANGYNTFSPNNIKTKRVKLKPSKKNRPTTNVKKQNTSIDWNANIITLPSNTLPLKKICSR